VGLADAGRAEPQERIAVGDPASRGELAALLGIDRLLSIEVERVECPDAGELGDRGTIWIRRSYFLAISASQRKRIVSMSENWRRAASSSRFASCVGNFRNCQLHALIDNGTGSRGSTAKLLIGHDKSRADRPDSSRPATRPVPRDSPIDRGLGVRPNPKCCPRPGIRAKFAPHSIRISASFSRHGRRSASPRISPWPISGQAGPRDLDRPAASAAIALEDATPLDVN
jgi:hypothetical protein